MSDEHQPALQHVMCIHLHQDSRVLQAMDGHDDQARQAENLPHSQPRTTTPSPSPDHEAPSMSATLADNQQSSSSAVSSCDKKRTAETATSNKDPASTSSRSTAETATPKGDPAEASTNSGQEELHAAQEERPQDPWSSMQAPPSEPPQDKRRASATKLELHAVFYHFDDVKRAVDDFRHESNTHLVIGKYSLLVKYVWFHSLGQIG